MNFSFDHLVWFMNKPMEAISLLGEKGIQAVKGGRHETWGTYNTLVYFGLSYIEFLGIDNPELVAAHEENRLVVQIAEQLQKDNQEGPATIALRTDSINELAVKLKEEGYTVYGPLPGERTRTDGETIRWSLLFAEDKQNSQRLPFFIQWEKSDQERLAELGQSTVNFESVGFVVRDLDKAAREWGKLFSLEQSDEFVDTNLNACCRKLALSGTNLLFCSPLGEGPAAQALEERGEGPFLVNLTETAEPQFFEKMNGYWRFL